MGRPLAILRLFICIILCSSLTSAQLRQDFYAKICPDVEKIVRQAVTLKFQQTFVTAPAVIRLYFHDCFVQGCDASVMVASTPGNIAEKDNPDNLSLAGDGFDTVIKAKAAVDNIPSCKNRVSCADILALATRDAIALTGGPSYAVELGRLDGLRSNTADVTGNLPQPTFNLDQLNAMFARHNLTQADMIALSACHTIGVSHCGKFSNRIYSFSPRNPVDPSLNKQYATQLQSMCPRNVDPTIVIQMDPTTPNIFDNAYFKNLKNGEGLFTSDQVLYTDRRSRPTVNIWAKRPHTFNNAFVESITKLGRVGVKTGKNGNIRFNCGKFN